MLTASERVLVNERGYCLTHEERLTSIVEGEPFYAHGLMYYFDGRKLLVCGYPIDGCMEDAASKVRAVVGDCVQSLPVEVIWYCGPVRVSLVPVLPSRLRFLRAWRPCFLDAELALDCRADLSSRRLRQWLRSPECRRFSIRRARWPEFSFTSGHYALVDRFFDSIEITPYILNTAFKIPTLARLNHVEWLEAWEEGRLAGLAAVADGFQSMNLAVFLAYATGSRGVSDALYAGMREASRERGVRFLNLGPSPSEGHYRFKTKWGAKPASAPCWWQAWGAGSLAHQDYDSWPARLIQFGFAGLGCNETR